MWSLESYLSSLASHNHQEQKNGGSSIDSRDSRADSTSSYISQGVESQNMDRGTGYAPRNNLIQSSDRNLLYTNSPASNGSLGHRVSTVRVSSTMVSPSLETCIFTLENVQSYEIVYSSAQHYILAYMIIQQYIIQCNIETYCTFLSSN